MDDISDSNGNHDLAQSPPAGDGEPAMAGGNGNGNVGPSVAERVAAQISDAIMLGEYPLGTWIRQEQLAQRFQVSRQPIREALRLLEVVGMIQARPRRGVRVSGPAPRYINDGYMIRSELEGLATRLAAERRSAEQLAQMRDVLGSFKAGVREAMARDSDADVHAAWIGNHDRFHALIHDASGIERLAQLISAINMSLPHNLSISALRAEDALEENLRQHELILTAIELRLPDVAEAAMEEHVRRSGELIARWFSRQQAALGDDDGDLDDDQAEAS
jgi:DNA-binding GntR family transcriptional regulator